MAGSAGSANSTSAAKAAILAKIRAATGSSVDAAAVQADWGSIPRSYKRQATRSREAIVELLTDRLMDYDAQVVHVTADGVKAAVLQRLTERKVSRMLTPAGVPSQWLPEGFVFVEDNGLPAAEMDALDGVLTGATLAIAETGTIVLQNVPGQGRRVVSLVPDYHLCVVNAADVVETVPEAMSNLNPTAKLATTFLSGPSATADIEMTRIKGVHGPRFLDVIVVQ